MNLHHSGKLFFSFLCVLLFSLTSLQVSAQLFSQDSLKLISRQFTFTEGPVAEDVTKPNGIVGSADGKYLYVADIERNKIYRYTIDKTVISEAKPRSLTRVLME